MAEFTGGHLHYNLPNATLGEIAQVLTDLSTLSVQSHGPDDQPVRLKYSSEDETLTVEF